MENDSPNALRHRVLEWCEDSTSAIRLGTVDNIITYLLYSNKGLRIEGGSFYRPAHFPALFAPEGLSNDECIGHLCLMESDLSVAPYKEWDTIYQNRLSLAMAEIIDSRISILQDRIFKR
jgi:hypothetical protein